MAWEVEDITEKQASYLKRRSDEVVAERKKSRLHHPIWFQLVSFARHSF